MSSSLIDWPSLAKAIAVHVVIAAFFLIGWSVESKPVETKPVPSHIKAVVVERPKPVKKPVVKKTVKKKVVKKKPVKKKPPKPKKKPVKKPVVKKEPAKKKVEVKKPKARSFEDLFAEETKELQKQEDKVEQDKKQKLEEQRKDKERQLEIDRQQAAQAERIASELDTYKSLIQQTMKRYWKKPPVARENLVVKLSIRLLPGGEVMDVKVTESSGNAAFDRSAETAVKKAGRFSVPSDPALFDKHFRSFTMIFNPNDV